LHDRWRGDLGEERRDWVGVELEEEFTGGGSGTFKVYFCLSYNFTITKAPCILASTPLHILLLSLF
jgi:hypothetical protein